MARLLRKPVSVRSPATLIAEVTVVAVGVGGPSIRNLDHRE
jgi:hypothetical protein